MSEADWQRFKPQAVTIAVSRRALIRDHGDVLDFLHPQADEAIRISAFDDADSVVIRAGWFLRLVVDISSEHMAASALADLAAIFDGGAVEYIGLAGGIAVPAGYRVIRADGGETIRGADRRIRQSASHPVAAWTI